MTSPPPPAEPNPNQPIAGWYPDPNVGQLRYWDGQGWTEHLAPYPDSDPGAPSFVQAAGIDPTGNDPTGNDPTGSGDRLPALGQWLSETFKLVIDQAGHLFTLLVVLTFAIDLMSAAITWFALRDLVITFTDDNPVSFDGASGWIALAVIASILSIAAKIALAASAARHVLAARTGVPESWADTLREATARLPRLIGSIVAFFGAFFVLYVCLVIPLSVVALLVPVLGLFALLAVFVGLMAGLARIGFGPVMSLIAPAGQGGVRKSISLTKGATLALTKRLAMLGMIGFTMLFIAGLFTSPFLGGESQLVATNDVLDFGDIVGTSPAAFVLSQVIGGIVAGAFATLVGGGLGLLYADLGGAIEPSITDVDPSGTPATPTP